MRVREFVGAIVAIFATSAMAQPEKSSLIWETKEAALAGKQGELRSLYEMLYELKRSGVTILTRPAKIPNESGAAILKLTSDEKLYVGNGENFPKALDLLLCALNGEKCTVMQESEGQSRARWSKIRDEEILIPDVRLEATEQVSIYNKKKGDRISSIVVNERMGCSTYDEACEAKVKHLNFGASKLTDDYQGVILIPSVAYSTRLPIGPSIAQDIAEGNIATKLGAPSMPAIRFMGNVLIAPILVRPNTSSANDKVKSETKKLVLKLIKYHRLDRSDDRVLKIGLVDSLPDLAHCDFDLTEIIKRKQLLNFSNDPSVAISTLPDLKENTDCGKFTSIELAQAQHGTHLFGLWIAKKGAKSGEGMLPIGDKTYIGLADMDYSKMSQPDYYRRMGSIITRMSYEFRTINLSWGVPETAVLSEQGNLKPKNDPVGASITRMGVTGSSPVLFVAAAGNDSKDLGKAACDITPACGPSERRNVLTVTALTNSETDPDIPPLANFGRLVDIGVPADNLVSTIGPNLIGAASGSSQAAAIASGAASMLMYGTGLTPEQVRNRLIYTSDLTPKLQAKGGRLFGGRLNFTRAAALSSSLVSLKETKGAEVQATVNFDKPNRPITIISAENPHQPVAIDASTIKRLFKNGGNDPTRPYTLFYVAGSPKKLVRVDGALPSASLNTPVNVFILGVSLWEGQLRDINDYTAAGPMRDD